MHTTLDSGQVICYYCHLACLIERRCEAVTIIVGGLVAYFVMGSTDEEINDTNPQEMKQKSHKQNSDSNFLTIGPIYPMDKFIVNLVSNGGRRYLKTSMDVELSSEEMSIEMDSKKSLVRDIMIRILSSKTFEEISTKKGKENLKEELVEAINEVLSDGSKRNAYDQFGHDGVDPSGI